ncbi:MAG TPA: hypothetical protein VEP66_17675 [Myxococcales bacterium]|nr:hypothetical protein [Myxococcales bacterium]
MRRIGWGWMGAALLLGCDLGKPTHSVNIGFSGDGSGQVRSTSPRFDCSGQCRQSVEANSTIELTAVPADGSAFAGWQGACSGSGTCTVMLDADRQVTASFSIVPRTSCTGIAPPDDRAMQQYPLAGGDDFVGCGNAVGDETGGLAFVRNYDNPNLHADSLDFFLPAMNRSVGWGMAQGVGAFQQPVGVSAVSVNPYLGPVQVRGYLLQNFDAAARSSGYAFVYGGELTVVPDPSGGILFAGDLGTSKYDPLSWTATPLTPIAHSALMYAGGGSAPQIRWGPKPLASAGTVYGGGVDTVGRSLILTDGNTRFGEGAISAQWFDRDGTALTDEFLLIPEFVAGNSTWFETSPLIGAGLMIRRMDGVSHAQALLVVSSGSSSPQPAPRWMTSRPDSRFQITRGGRGYAVLPYAATGVRCTQRLEVLAPDGTSCGAREYPIDAGTCDTEDLALSANGTVLQRMPDAVQTRFAGTRACVWRAWPGALR